MPDRATIEAATPRCPAGDKIGPAARRVLVPCDRLLEWDDGKRRWRCAQHGDVTAESIMLGQAGYELEAAA